MSSAQQKRSNDECSSSNNNNAGDTSLLWDMLTHMQANIDDATPELLAHAIELLMNNGAMDAWVQPIIMKKGRPAHTLHCLCRSESSSKMQQPDYDVVNATQNTPIDVQSKEHRLLNTMFRHTTTLGIRIHRNILRAALQRKFVEVQLPYKDNARDGKVNVKMSSLGGEVVSVKAEFDHCKVVSQESDVPLKIVASVAERLGWEEASPTSK